VRRVRELIAWVSAGELDRIRSGSYLKRGQEPPPSEEFDTALEHYRQRFTTMLERAGEGIATVLDRIGSWLAGDGGSPPPGGTAT
jgi:hypothetical protein